MRTFPAALIFSILTAGLVLMGLGAFVFGLDDMAGLVIFAVGVMDVVLAAVFFVRSQHPPTG